MHSPFKSTVALFVLLGSLLFIEPLFATSALPGKQTIDWIQMSMMLLGGLALFLFGLDLMIKGLLTVAGEQMKNLLAKMTTNRFTGTISGFVVTAITQSSSVTTVLVVGFVSAGLMTMSQSAGVIIGANVGSTITAQIIAFKITEFAYLMVAVGFFTQFLAQTSRNSNLGTLVLGLGILFLGMELMSQGMRPLRDYQPFFVFMQQMSNPAIGILAGFIFTALIQSSAATVGIAIVMASNGLLSLEAGIALAMGANIGTCATALLATIGKSREALRTATFHVLFNVFGVLIWLPFIPYMVELTQWVSPTVVHESGDLLATLAQNSPRQIANANTLLNLSLMVLFLPLIPVLTWAVMKLIPVIAEESSTRDIKPEQLKDEYLEAPALALASVRTEMLNFGNKMMLFYRHTLQHINSKELKPLTFEDQNLQKLKVYQLEILTYLGKISRASLDDNQQATYLQLMNTTVILEEMLEAMGSNLLQTNHKLLANNLKISPKMMGLLDELGKQVGKAIENAIGSLDEIGKADAVIAIKSEIDHLILESLKHQATRFDANQEHIQIFRLEMQIVDGFKRLHTLSKRLARTQMSSDKKNLAQDNGLLTP